MTDKPKFFFEADNQSEEYSLSSQEHADSFFSTLQAAGIIQEAPLKDLDEQKVEADAAMRKVENKVLCVEYGTYQANYAIHITPTHPQKNLKSQADVERALWELVKILHDYVPQTVQVDLFLPRKDWQMKVISAVIKDWEQAWALDIKKLEEEGIPALFQGVEKVIMEVRS
jgi:hypothetical protein